MRLGREYPTGSCTSAKADPGERTLALDQHSIVIVMMVVFSSTLLISAGLLFALRASRAGRLWGCGYLLLSSAGLMLATNAVATQWVTAGALAYLASLGGQLMVYWGIRCHFGLAPLTRLQGAGATIALAALMVSLATPQGDLHFQAIGYVAAAAIAAASLLVLRRKTETRGSIGIPLVSGACAVHLATMVFGLAASLGTGVLPVSLVGSINSIYGISTASAFNMVSSVGNVSIAAGSASPMVLATLVATLVGLFGFTVLAMETIIASKERGARTDGLTGLLNRSALDGAALAMVAGWKRYRHPITCLVIDVDHFKLVNDRSGHRAGDTVLKRIAQALDHSRRASDIAGRYGGEEFCILCPNTDEMQATALANRILRKVRTVELPGGANSFASVSIGIAELHGAPASADALWQQLFCDADRALYAAKNEGRDRFVLASTLEPELSLMALPGLDTANGSAGLSAG